MLKASDDGCAGGEVVTTTDEVGRRQRVYSDILGRTFKQEDLKMDGSVYRTMASVYNVRDQVTEAVQRAGVSGVGQTTALSYDGHGRRRTLRTPSALGDTVYDYYANDAVQKVTDGRGAAATYTYNARSLVTAVDYTVPAGVAQTANARMDYDETGNREWVTDGEGRVDYVYDTLSRLKEETRQFNNVNRSHKLEYEYNLAGAVRSITDPFGAKVNYTLDSAGRLESVTGENFAGGGSYAAGMKYRAWGALKEMGYGNGLTAKATYNARGQVASFGVTGRNAQVGTPTVMSAEYEYYGDGSIRYMDNLIDDRFDRAFIYDDVGRLTQALSGGGAQNFYTGTTASTVERPYTQAMGHDEWGNMTSSASMFWSQFDGVRTANYSPTTGTNAAWEYDAAGNLTRDANRFYEWDAAGRNARAISIHNAQHTLVQGFSGDGVRVRKVETAATSVTTYYVTSSVLGGRAVTELNAAGEKTTTYVYGAGEVIAKQEVAAGGATSVRWVHQDPLVGSRQETSVTGATLAHTESDAQGIDVGTSNPYAGGSGIPNFVPGIPGLLPNFNFPDGRCLVDGLAFDCREAAHLLGIGVAIPAPVQTVVGIYSRSQQRYVGLAIWNQQAAQDGIGFLGQGSTGFLPAGVSYSGRGFSGENVRQWFTQGGLNGSNRDFLPIAAFREVYGNAPQSGTSHKVEVLPQTKVFGRNQEITVSNILFDIGLNKMCNDAFKDAGLTTPDELLTKGIVIGGSALLWTESKKGLGINENVNVEKYKEAFLANAQAGTVSDINNVPRTLDGRARIFLAPSAFLGESYFYGRLSLRDVITHELIHAAGIGVKESLLGSHDLSGFDAYGKILKACR